jgi:hypothetical protein
MSSKKGIGIVGVIVLLIVLFFILAFIKGTIIPGIQKLPETGKQQLVKVGILPEDYYKLSFGCVGCSQTRGHVEFTVEDPETNMFTTDFDKTTGYQVSEGAVGSIAIPTLVENLQSYPSLHVALISDSDKVAVDCATALSAIKQMNFNNTYVSSFPTDVEQPFVHVDSVAACSGTTGLYWTAIQNATNALPTGDTYKAVIIITNGTDATDQALVEDATTGLFRSDINAIYIVTSEANCEVNPDLKTTDQIMIAARTKTKGCIHSDPTNIAAMVDTIAADVATIKLTYKPIAKVDNMNHIITVKATKRPYSGHNNITIKYD